MPTDPNLETQVRQEAERQLQEAALADGVLRTAQQNAGSTITSLLQGWDSRRLSSTKFQLEFDLSSIKVPETGQSPVSTRDYWAACFIRPQQPATLP